MPSLELLASGPGTGKTSYCIESFRKELLRQESGLEGRSFFVLPNREHAGRIQDLVLEKGVRGLFNAHILTIHDLTARWLGLSAAVRPTDAVRKRVLKEVLGAPSAAKKFPYYAEVKDAPGFHELLIDVIKEFRAGLLDIRRFERLAQPLLKDAVFRAKFRNFSVLFKSYGAALHEAGFVEPEEEIEELLAGKSIRHAADLVIFDGFYHFSQAQKELLRYLARASKRMIVTLTLPADYRRRQEVFFYPAMTRDFLATLGFKAKPLPSANRRTSEPALRHLEKSLFSASPAPACRQAGVFAGKTLPIAVFEASGIETEARMIAREIRRLYRETTFHYSDICIILRRIGEYEKTFAAVFREYGLPVFIHERKKLIEDGRVKTLYRFLKLITGGWNREDLFFVLRSSCFGRYFPLEDILSLEAISGVQGGRDAWRGLLSSFELSGGAKKALGFMVGWEEKILASSGAADFLKRLQGFLDLLSGGETQAELEALRSLGLLLQKAAQYQSASTRSFGALAFIQELEDWLGSALYSSRPRGRNRVQVYDSVMAIPKEYEAVFLAGLLERRFPEPVTEDPFFKDEERRVLNRQGPVLEERAWRATGERYFFYMNVTRAKKKLYFSYPLYDAEARPALVSFFVDEAARCFEKPFEKKTHDLDDLLPASQEWESGAEISLGLAEPLFSSEKPPGLAADWLYFFNEWIEKESFRQVLAYGFSDRKAVLRDPKALEFFAGQSGPFSPTRLEKYATCAFRYHAEKVLRLAAPPGGREEMEMGTLLHSVLEDFYGALSEKEKRSGAYLRDEGAVRAKLGRLLEKELEKKPFKNAPLYRQNVFRLGARRTLDLFVSYEKKLSEKRPFVPAHFELDFGPEAERGCLRIRDGEGDILVRGKIDRVDVSEDGKSALIIDYKLSKRDLHGKLKKGLELQIPLYLSAVRQLLGLDVAGGELRFLKEPGIEGLYAEEHGPALGLGPRKRVHAREELERLLSEAEETVRQNVRRLRRGDISVRSKSCDFCDFNPVCRFEKWKLVYSPSPEIEVQSSDEGRILRNRAVKDTAKKDEEAPNA